MDYGLLLSWLRLPPGPWPPDHYALLGLLPEGSEPSVVEQRVMERMDVLRRHQLRHPELVTEGMNRLAQALVCLTDPEERAAYDAQFRAKLPAVEEPLVISPEAAEAPGIYDLQEPPENTTSTGTQAYRGQLYREGLEPPLEFDDDDTPAPSHPSSPAFEAVPNFEPAAAPVVEAAVVEAPVSNRGLYQRLAVVRRCLRHWDELAPVLANPDELLDRPAAVFTFLQAVNLASDTFPDLRRWFGLPGSPGGTALAVVCQSLVADTIRNLLPDQRTLVAVDWRKGRAVLEGEKSRLRQLCRGNRKARTRQFFRMIASRLRRNPWLWPASLVTLSLLLARIRSSAAR